MPHSASSIVLESHKSVNEIQSRIPWLPLGYLLIVALLLFRLAYIASGAIELSKDEAYQWLWSKHLALSYYSKPPGIALIQFAGTHLWGDKELGVRFFSPVCAAILSFVMLRFMARHTSPRLAFLLLIVISCVPLMGIGTVLMTIDPPLVLFWTLALVASWRAMQPDGATGHWLLAGLATGLGFLCKYNALYLLICWALFFALWKPSRIHLKQPGPYLAVLAVVLCALPVLIWNAQHGWITAHHVAANAALEKEWKPTLRFFLEFTLAEFALLNPIFFVGMIWAAFAFWKKRNENPLWLYFFCTGAPVFFGHWLYSFHSRVQPNWIAPSVVPLFCLTLLYWDARWRKGLRAVKAWLIAGVGLGLLMMIPMHESDLIGKLIGHPLPGEMDPLRRVRAWRETSAVVEAARQKLLLEGKPAFIVADHYGMTGEFSFYIPAARETVQAEPLVYCVSSPKPQNQLFFWPEYQYAQTRKGQNAVYVDEFGPYPLEKGWLWRWLTGKKVEYGKLPPRLQSQPQILQAFTSVTDLGEREIKIGDRVFRRVRLYECRDLR